MKIRRQHRRNVHKLMADRHRRGRLTIERTPAFNLAVKAKADAYFQQQHDRTQADLARFTALAASIL